MVIVEIGAHPMPQRKTIEHLKNALRHLCGEWQIEYEKVQAVVSDGGQNIKMAIRQEFGVDKHISCAGHLLNNIGHAALGYKTVTPSSELEPQENILVPVEEEEALDILDEDDNEEEVTVITSVKDLIYKTKRIVKFFRKSEVAGEELRSHQRQRRMPELKPIQEVRTRWNSTYYMLERFLQLADLVSMVLFKLQREKSTKRKPPPMLIAEDIETLTEVRDLLKPLEEATTTVCKDKSVCLSDVIPMVSGLKKVIAYEILTDIFVHTLWIFPGSYFIFCTGCPTVYCNNPSCFQSSAKDTQRD